MSRSVPMVQPITTISATPDHADAIAALWHESWHDAHAALLPREIVAPRTLSSFKERLKPLLPHTLVALTNGTIGGFATVLNDELYQFYAGRPARGRGLAGQLLQKAEQRLSETGVSVGVVHCLAGNARALQFYERHGWRGTGVTELPIWMPEGSQAVTVPSCLLKKRLG